jgi:hypothetical protein
MLLTVVLHNRKDLGRDSDDDDEEEEWIHQLHTDTGFQNKENSTSSFLVGSVIIIVWIQHVCQLEKSGCNRTVAAGRR